MIKIDELLERKLWTQNEVAEFLRVSPGTVKNWRDRGLLSYVQVSGSTRVLYHRDEIIAFIENCTKTKKGGVSTTRLGKLKKGKPVVSSTEEDWRI